MRRASSPLRGETRPQKRICPPRHALLTQICHTHPSRFSVQRVRHHFSSVWQLGDALGFPPLQSVLLPPADHVLGDTIGSLLQRTDPVPTIFQSSASLSFIPNKDAGGFPSWWRASLLPGLVDTPSQVCLPQHDTLIPLSHFIHEWERLPGVSLWALSKYLPQVARPHGSGLPCVAPRVASHEAVPLVDERAEITPHDTSHSPNQLLSTPFTMAGPRFSPEWGQNGCDSLSPYDHDGRINDGLGRGLRRQTGMRGMDRKVPFLAHKLPGTQGCLPGFDAFSPRSWGASYNSQNGQMVVVSHINRQGGSRSRTLDRLARRLLLWSQGKFLSLRAVHVPGILNLAADFLSRQKLRPGEWMLNRQTVSQIWNLFDEAEMDLFASQESSQCPLWFSLSFPTTLGIDAFAHPWPNVSLYAFPPVKLIPAVLCRVKVSGARLLFIAPFWPSQI